MGKTRLVVQRRPRCAPVVLEPVERELTPAEKRFRLRFRPRQDVLEERVRKRHLAALRETSETVFTFFRVARKTVYKGPPSPEQGYIRKRHHAKHRGIPFDLSLDEFKALWQQPCSYCGASIDTYGIDRIDNAGSYTRDNCVPCCVACNTAKGTRTLEEWHAHMVDVLLRAGVIGP